MNNTTSTISLTSSNAQQSTLETEILAAEQTYNEIVFIDAGVTDAAVLAAGVRLGVQVVMLDSSLDGLTQIVESLAGRSGLDAIHILSHASPGVLNLGGTTLDVDGLARRVNELSVLGDALSEAGDILLYGCNVGRDEVGATFLKKLSDATGADIAASNDLTGATALGGDWVLERGVGSIESTLAISERARENFTGVLAPADQNFEGQVVNTEVSNFDGLIFSADVGGVGIVSAADWGEGIGSGKGMFFNYHQALAASFSFRSSDLNNDFVLKSFDINVYGPGTNYAGTYTISGYNGGAGGTLVASQTLDFSSSSGSYGSITYTKGTPYGGTVAFSSAWSGIDTIVFSESTGDYAGAFIDHIDFETYDPPPTLSSATIPSSGTYVAGQNLDFTVTYNEAVTVNTGGGTPRITLTLDTGGTVYADYHGGSGTSTLTFRYTVGTGTLDSNGITVGTSIALNGGTIKDGGGNNAPITGIAFASTAAVLVDGVAPTVSSINRADTSPTTADSVNYTVTFNESVTGVDASDFALTSTGTAAGSIASVSGSGSTYTVTVNSISGDGTLRLDLNGSGTGIADAATNAITTGYTSGQTYTIDNTGPAVTSVSASTANGTYKVGDTIAITVTFNDTVAVTGSPTLALNSGGTAIYASGTGTNTLTFNYTVGAGNAAADLDYSATSSLALSGGTIKDTVGNNATLTLPTVGGGSSLGGQKNIVVDGVAPTLASATVPSNGTYVSGQNLDFTVTYSEAVAVTGSPRVALTLDTGGTVHADYVSGSGTSTLTFRYSVGNGTQDSNGIAVGTSIDLNSGTIKDAAGNDAAINGIAFGSTTAVLVDGTAPSVASITRANATPTNASSVDFTVTMSESVTGVDASDFVLTSTGTASGSIASVSGSGGTYTVTVNGLTGDGTLRLDLNGAGTGIADTAGNAIAAGYTSGQLYTIDKTVPSVSSVSASTANGTYKAGDTVAVTVTFNENVAVTGAPTLALNSDGTATYASGSGTNTLTFNYTVSAGNVAADLDYSATNSLSLAGGAIKDAAGNDATLTLPTVGGGSSLGGQKNIVVDGVAPTVAAAAVPSNGTYAASQNLDFTVTYSEAVTVTGSPRIALTLDAGGTVYADYVSNSVPNTLTFQYTVGTGTLDSNGIAVDTSIALNSGTIKDAAGNDAALTGIAFGATTAVLVDGAVPTVTSVAVPANGTYKTGDNLDFTLQMSEAVTVNTAGGTPQLSLTLNTGGTVDATYLSGSGTSNLVFRYTVANGNVDADGITVGTLTTNGGTLRDAAGNNATLTLNSVGSTANVKIDTVAPTLNTAPFNVNENSANATVVGTASGSDDTTLTYSLTDTASGRFVINASTGQITVANGSQLNFEAAASHQVTVRATDVAGNHTDTAFTINLNNVNDVPVIAANTGTTLTAGGLQVVTTAMLNVTDDDQAAAALTYTVQSLPTKGTLKLNSTVLAVNDTFTQADINAGKVSYVSTGTTGTDTFAFTVSDGAGGNIASTSFNLNVSAPSSDGGGSTPAPTTTTVDGVAVQTQTTIKPDGSVNQIIVIPVVTDSRVEIVGNNTVADIPLAKTEIGTAVLTAQVPTGVGLQVTGSSAPKQAGNSLADLIQEIQAHTTSGSADQNLLSSGGSGFLSSLPTTSPLLVQTIVPTVAAGTGAPSAPLTISGTTGSANDPMTALVIDARGVPTGSTLKLDNVEFAAIIGSVRVIGGAGSQNVWGDSSAQYIVLGADDDVLHGGGGDDTVGSEGGNDRLFGDAGNDTLFGGIGQDLILGGADTDTVTYSGNQTGYKIERNGKIITVRSLTDPTDADTLVNVESIKFADGTVTLPNDFALATSTQVLAGLYVAFYDRAPDNAGLHYWMSRVSSEHLSVREIATAFASVAKFGETYSTSLTTAQFVAKIYQNILGIEGDVNGRAYWEQLINAGLSRTDFVGDFVTAALNFNAATSTSTGSDLSNAAMAKNTLNNKVDVGLHFAAALAEKSNGAVDSTAYTQSIDVLAGVGHNSDSVENAVIKIDVVGGSTGFGSAVALGPIFA